MEDGADIETDDVQTINARSAEIQYNVHEQVNHPARLETQSVSSDNRCDAPLCDVSVSGPGALCRTCTYVLQRHNENVRDQTKCRFETCPSHNKGWPHLCEDCTAFLRKENIKNIANVPLPEPDIPSRDSRDDQSDAAEGAVGTTPVVTPVIDNAMVLHAGANSLRKGASLKIPDINPIYNDTTRKFTGSLNTAVSPDNDYAMGPRSGSTDSMKGSAFRVSDVSPLYNDPTRTFTGSSSSPPIIPSAPPMSDDDMYQNDTNADRPTFGSDDEHLNAENVDAVSSSSQECAATTGESLNQGLVFRPLVDVGQLASGTLGLGLANLASLATQPVDWAYYVNMEPRRVITVRELEFALNDVEYESNSFEVDIDSISDGASDMSDSLSIDE